MFKKKTKNTIAWIFGIISLLMYYLLNNSKIVEIFFIPVDFIVGFLIMTLGIFGKIYVFLILSNLIIFLYGFIIGYILKKIFD